MRNLSLLQPFGGGGRAFALDIRAALLADDGAVGRPQDDHRRNSIDLVLLQHKDTKCI